MEMNPQNVQLLDTEAVMDMPEDRFLVFTIDGQSYAIEVHYTVDIVAMPPITRIPFLPTCMKGIINLRGSVIPTMNVRLRFGLPEQEYTERTCIIVLNNDGMELGLIVDALQEVTNIPKDRRMPPPDAQAGENLRYIKGMANVGGDIKLLLDCDKLMEI